MLTIKQVTNKKEQKEFINFPLNLYKDNPFFVPPLYGDEKKLFSADNVYSDTCDTIYFNAYKDGKMVGRISGIIQKSYNVKNNEKRVRFTRFDSIDDQDVANALFSSVEKWAISKGMDTFCGPLGFSDLDREGLLIEGFDQLATFEEQYNAPYYQKLIENCGFKKEVDWTESKIYAPNEGDDTLDKLSEFVLNRYNLHVGTAKSTNEFIKKYGTQIFELIDKSYDDIYGTVPFSEKMRDDLIKSFKLVLKMNNIVAVLDENDKMICFGFCFPSIAKAVQKSKGKLTPLALCRLLKAINKPKIIDLCLIGVDPEYMNRGISSVIAAGLAKILRRPEMKYAETNLSLEDNYNIQNMWKRFNEVKHKRRRAFVKTIGE